MDQLVPQKSIVPIVKGHKDQAITSLLGTGFFVGKPSALYLVTAKHVFQSNPLGDSEHYAFVLQDGGGIGVWNLPKLHVSRDYDVAVCPVNSDAKAAPLQFSREQPALNEDVFSYEYSNTSFERKPLGGTHISFEPLSHKGNVVRYYDSNFPESIVTPSFLTSFPALQGASGAPVMFGTTKKKIRVTGILVANQERHLLPAQIVRIEEGPEFTEETRYFLPYGKAMHSKVFLPFLVQLGVENLYGDSAGFVERIKVRLQSFIHRL